MAFPSHHLRTAAMPLFQSAVPLSPSSLSPSASFVSEVSTTPATNLATNATTNAATSSPTMKPRNVWNEPQDESHERQMLDLDKSDNGRSNAIRGPTREESSKPLDITAIDSQLRSFQISAPDLSQKVTATVLQLQRKSEELFYALRELEQEKKTRLMAERQLDELQLQHGSLRNENETLRVQLQEKAVELEITKVRLSRQQEESDDSEIPTDDRSLLLQQLKDATDNLQLSNQAYHELGLEYDSLVEEYNQLQQYTESLKDAFARDMTEVKALLDSYETQLTESKQIQEALRTQLDDEQSKLDREEPQRKIDTTRNEHQDPVGILSAPQKQLMIELNVAKLQQTNESLAQENALLRDQISKLFLQPPADDGNLSDAIVNQMQQQLEMAQHREQDLKTSLQHMEVYIGKVVTEMEKIDSRYADNILIKDKTISALQEELQKLREGKDGESEMQGHAIIKVASQYEIQAKQLQEAHDINENLKRRVDKAEQDLSFLIESLKTTLGIVQDRTISPANIIERVRQICVEMDQIQAEYHSLQAGHLNMDTAAKEIMRNLQERLDSEIKKSREFQDSLKQKAAEYRGLEVQLESTKEELEHVKLNVQELNHQLRNQANLVADTFKHQIQELHQKVETYHRQVENLLKLNEKYEEAVKDLESENQLLARALSQATSSTGGFNLARQDSIAQQPHPRGQSARQQIFDAGVGKEADTETQSSCSQYPLDITREDNEITDPVMKPFSQTTQQDRDPSVHGINPHLPDWVRQHPNEATRHDGHYQGIEYYPPHHPSIATQSSRSPQKIVYHDQPDSHYRDEPKPKQNFTHDPHQAQDRALTSISKIT
eukprot:TRINITY_DN4996_c0_g1_i12.p1 TRINITY_DN4996_c0_g1~~TRINITY_DN4996_c0_g1_i12.p1  ORF type:complete len:837 (+),score=192.59 TRINITY_DN4996_c0_g1_i12:71-2581(+)